MTTTEANNLTTDEEAILDGLTSTEIQQLIDMWTNSGSPSLPSSRTLVGFF